MQSICRLPVFCYRRETLRFPAKRAQWSQVSGQPRFAADLENLAAARGWTPSQAWQAARREFEQIMTVPAPRLACLAAALATWLLGRVFRPIEISGLEDLKQAAAGKPILLVAMHRSHFDYLLLGVCLYFGGLGFPAIAAGMNLNFFPVGWFLRRSAAYFVRRRAEDRELHSLMLRAYLSFLVGLRVHHEFFIEGGRSRHGRMSRPRLGLLEYIAAAVENHPELDCFVVPAAVSYAEVPEAPGLVREYAGAGKHPEDFWRLLKALLKLKLSYGSARVAFGPPVALQKLLQDLDGCRQHWDLSGGRMSALAQTINCSVAHRQALSAAAAAATVLLNPAGGTLELEIFIGRCLQLRNAARLLCNSNLLEGILPELETLPEPGSDPAAWVRRLPFVELLNRAGRLSVTIPGSRRLLADYYLGLSLRSLLPLAAALIADGGSFEIYGAAQQELYLAFRYELQLDPYEVYRNLADAAGHCLSAAPDLKGRLAHFLPAALSAALALRLEVNNRLDGLLPVGVSRSQADLAAEIYTVPELLGYTRGACNSAIQYLVDAKVLTVAAAQNGAERILTRCSAGSPGAPLLAAVQARIKTLTGGF